MPAELSGEFWRDGAVCLRGIFGPEELEGLRRGLARNVAEPGPGATSYSAPGEPGAFYDDYCNWQRIPEYEAFIRQSRAGEAAGELMGSTEVRLYHEHVLVKEPGTREITPWHHDLPYYGLSGDQLCSLWIPLDPVPRAFCPVFVAGSHRWDDLFYPRFFLDHADYGEGIEGYRTVPDLDAASDEHPRLSWTLSLGDCIAFHMRTVHGAPATTELAGRRRGFAIRWLGDDARFASRPWPTSPRFPDLSLRDGDPLEGPLFPLVWSASD